LSGDGPTVRDRPPEQVRAHLPGPGPGTCPRCGTGYAPRQEYCLECGLRLPRATGVVSSLGGAWRRRLPWYPGDWVWPALLFLVIASVGGAAAVLASRGEEQTTLVATTAVRQAAQTVTGTQDTATQTLPTAPTETSAAPPPPPSPTPPAASGSLTDWPAGQRGYTTVLRSIPTSRGRAAATEEARKALSAGLAEVGLLSSDDYSSLHPGFYVVFTGVRASFAEAEADVERARSSGFEEAYPREITP